jgi:hypothetical protein
LVGKLGQEEELWDDNELHAADAAFQQTRMKGKEGGMRDENVAAKEIVLS